MQQKLSLLSLLLICFFRVQSQTISPDEPVILCPGVDITFTVSVPGRLPISIEGFALSISPIVVQGPSNIIESPNYTTFTFVGRFSDYNRKQTFRIHYRNPDLSLNFKNFTFPHIKSLRTPNPYSQINQTPLTISAPICEIQNFNISFNNVNYSNPWDEPSDYYGLVTDYEYLLPLDWSIGSNVSNGNDWIMGDNNVTVTSGLSHGNNGKIKIRPVNSCASGLLRGQEVEIPISRPEPNIYITGNQDLCSGSTDYTLNSVPAGATVSWTSSNPSAASISSTGNPGTLTKLGDGIVTLTGIATINGTCSVSTVKTVRVGYNYVNATIQGSAEVYPYAGYSYSLTTNPYNLTISNFVWRVPSGWSIVSGQGTSTINVWTGSVGGAVEVDFDDACGVNIGKYKTVTIGSGGGVPQSPTPPNDDTTLSLSQKNGSVLHSVDNNIIASEEKMAVFPNPAKNYIMVSTSKKLQDGDIRIWDSKGRLVRTIRIVSTSTRVGIATLPKGLYFIQLANESKSGSVKFIKE